MGWKLKLLILAVVLLIVFSGYSFGWVGKIFAGDDAGEVIKAEVSDVSSDVAENLKRGVANASRELVNEITAIKEEREIDTEESFFEFEGSALGKSHDGTFEEWEGKVFLSDGRVTGINVTFQADSVKTGIRKLDNHLMSDDFFDVEKYPEINFVSDEVEGEKMEGVLTFRGVEKRVFFPIKDDDGNVSSTFFLPTSDFNFKYPGVDENVKISFGVVY